MVNEETPRETKEILKILDLPMQKNDAKATTVRDYLVNLLLKLWREGSAFSARRPFGNSGWEVELLEPLIRVELIEGEFDENGDISDCDEVAGAKLIGRAIEALRAPQTPPVCNTYQEVANLPQGTVVKDANEDVWCVKKVNSETWLSPFSEEYSIQIAADGRVHGRGGYPVFPITDTGLISRSCG